MRTGLDPAIVAALQERLGPLDGPPSALPGGITNRNYLATFAGRRTVVRLCAEKTEVLGIDRATEVIAAQRAAELGIGAEVLAHLPDAHVIVCDFLRGAALSAADVRARLPEIAHLLRAFHDTAPLPTTFDVFGLVAVQREVAREVPADYDALLATARRIQGVLAGHPDHELVPCHNDLLPGNFIGHTRTVRVVDWEYAGNDLRAFDLGNLAVNNHLTGDQELALLDAYWGGEVTPGRIAGLKLMRFMSDFREAMWGACQVALSALDVDYVTYADEHFERLRQTAADPRFEEWIRDGATP